MDVGHGIKYYRNMTDTRVVSNDGLGVWPRFSRQFCGGGNRNGRIFQEYNDGDAIVVTARNEYVYKPPGSPRNAMTLRDLGVLPAEERRAAALASFQFPRFHVSGRKV